MCRFQHYDPKRYWKRRKEVIDPHSKYPKAIRLLWLFYIKRCDAFNNASMGTGLNEGATFKGVPILPHHLNGIIVGYDVVIGEKVTIHQQVTIEQPKGGKTTVIGDNVFIGKGAVILGGCRIGNNVKIGANAVVTSDLPDNCTAVGVPAKVVRLNGMRIDCDPRDTTENVSIS